MLKCKSLAQGNLNYVGKSSGRRTSILLALDSRP